MHYHEMNLIYLFFKEKENIFLMFCHKLCVFFFFIKILVLPMLPTSTTKYNLIHYFLSIPKHFQNHLNYVLCFVMLASVV